VRARGTLLLVVCTAPSPRLQPVDENEQAEPHHVDEVPVPRDGLECEVVIGLEMAGQAARKDHRQHDRAQRHVETVEPGQHVESGAIHAGAELEVQLGVSVAVFDHLAGEKRHAQGDGEEHEEPV